MLRQNSHINARQASNFCSAIAFADLIGRPLNLFVTINFAHTGCLPGSETAVFERLRDNHFSPWLYYLACHGFDYGPPTHVWVFESAPGMMSVGSSCMVHVHWLVHVPPAYISLFCYRLGVWLEVVTASCPHYAIDARTVYNVSRLQRYLLKGLDPRHAAFFGVRPRYQGIISGKRCGVSLSLGPAARAKHHSLVGLKTEQGQALSRLPT
jgi:hypothetical protein